ncbi:MAG: aldehyde dehydrogenase family protein, partial [Anaerolineae bacterium]|nr:aldehyde dehydrogenase family protein [Anaerolineae bacterium]
MADKLTDAQIEAIARRVQGQTRGKSAAGSTTASAPATGSGVAPHLSYVGRAGRTVSGPAAAGRDGIYPDLDSAVAAARRGFRALDELTLEKRTEIVAAMRETMRRNAELLATMAREETGLGRAEDKVKKNHLV